jgi:sterol desaturase/sphingolipid hydroxylase (fatty acid hydroxylase superfamily)
MSPGHAFALPAWLPLSFVVWAGHMIVFHVTGLGFEWFDRTGAFKRFKVRSTDRLGYAQLLPRVLFNQTFILLPAMLLSEKLGLAFVGQPHLSLLTICIYLVLLAIGHDIVQYAGHRWLLHQPQLRWLGHHIHHSTGASKSIGACYMSPGDFFLNIVCPYLIPLILIGGGGSDIGFQLLVAGLGAIGGLYEHSGYDFAKAPRIFGFMPSALISSHAHGEHHRRSRVSFSDGFGSPGLCDALFRTRWDSR